MNLLKILPLSEPRLSVLFEIYAEGKDYLRNIAQRLPMNPSQLHNLLLIFSRAQVLEKQEQGKEILYSFQKNRDYALLITLLEEYHLEKVIGRAKPLRLMLNLLLSNKEVLRSSETILLFGSYAAGDFTGESDIDMLFVGKERKLFVKTCREMSVVVGKTINPLIYTPKKFAADLSHQEPLLSSLVSQIRNRAVIKSGELLSSSSR